MYKHTLLKVNQFESFIAKPIYCTFAKQTHNENYSYSLRWVFMLQHLMVYLIFFFFPEKHSATQNVSHMPCSKSSKYTTNYILL